MTEKDKIVEVVARAIQAVEFKDLQNEPEQISNNWASWHSQWESYAEAAIEAYESELKTQSNDNIVEQSMREAFEGGSIPAGERRGESYYDENYAIAWESFQAGAAWKEGELKAENVTLRQERDLAIAHDAQPYPTAFAYDKACENLNKYKAANTTLTQALDSANQTNQAMGKKLKDQGAIIDELEEELTELKSDNESFSGLFNSFNQELALKEGRVTRLESLLKKAKERLYNPFEPDNQSPFYYELEAALQQPSESGAV